jgi:transcriptional regulator with XRE-family HTH domain
VESQTSQQAIARRLTLIREQSGLNQAEFAAKLGIPKRSYLSWERMERDVPGALFVALMTVLDIDPAWVIAGPESYPRRLGDTSASRLVRLQRTLRSFADEVGVVLPHDQIESLAESVMDQRPDHEPIVLGAIRDSFYAQLGKKKNDPRKR